MIAALDVHYAGEEATAAALVFRDWTDAEPVETATVRVPKPAPYEPGRFYKRELPCLLRVLEELEAKPDTMVVDGHAWLGEGKPGLGAHLHAALHEKASVIGVAKKEFDGNTLALPVFRGKSKQPLWVTAAGVEPTTAAGYIQMMHGRHRLPTLLKRVDQLARGTYL